MSTTVQSFPENPKPKIIDSFRIGFFGTWERSVNSVSLILGIISLLLSVFLWQYPQSIPQLIILRDLVVILTLISANAILIYVVINQTKVIQEGRYKLKRVDAEISIQLREAYQIMHHYRDRVFSHFMPEITENLAYSSSEEELKLFRNICFFTTSGLRSAFLSLFKSRGIDIDDDIAISVKLIIPANNVVEMGRNFEEHKKRQILRKDKWVITIFRDPFTYNHHPEREVGGIKVYDIHNNTAFHHIFSSGHSLFFSNDLKSEGDHYLNENVNWKDHYNATLVVPIRYKDAVTEEQVCFGFLAIDSMNKDNIALFDSVDCKNLLKHSADSLATFFLSLALYKIKD